MITLLTGKKGSGKTKKLIELSNKAVQESNGSVVVLEKGLKLTYDISHKARLVDTDAYRIKGTESLSGFISGLCAGNHDITDLLVDSTLKITGTQASEIGELVEYLEKLSESDQVKIVLSVSCSDDEVPENISKYILK